MTNNFRALGEADEPVMPEGKKPTRDELWELWLRLNNELPDRPAAVAEFWEHAQINARARASLADEPTVPAPPADGEVAELVAWFSKKQKSYECFGCYDAAAKLTRAAELLERLSPPQPLANGEVGKPVAWMCPAEPYFDGNKWHDQWQVTLDQRLAEYWARPGKPTPLFTRAVELLQRQTPVPVAVSERPWEREGWCDVEGRFWAEHISRSGVASWRCAAASDLGGWAVRCLPAHDLPPPEVGED